MAEAQDGGSIDISGDGKQTRSLLYVDECIEGTIRLTRSGWTGTVNIGSDEMISINDLTKVVMNIAENNCRSGTSRVRARVYPM